MPNPLLAPLNFPAAIGKNKSVGPDSVSGEILKLGGEAMIP